MPNPVVHFEIGGRESEKTQRFFTELFDWKTEVAGPDERPGVRFERGTNERGEAEKIDATWSNPHEWISNWDSDRMFA